MDEKRDDIWALIISEGKRFLGRVDAVLVSYTNGGVEMSYFEESSTKITREMILVAPSRILRLKPVLDFVSIDQPMGQPDSKGNVHLHMQKNPVVLPFDYTLDPATLYTKWSTIMFIKDQSEKDQEYYMALVKEGLAKKDVNDKPLVQLAPPGSRVPGVKGGR